MINPLKNKTVVITFLTLVILTILFYAIVNETVRGIICIGIISLLIYFCQIHKPSEFRVFKSMIYDNYLSTGTIESNCFNIKRLINNKKAQVHYKDTKTIAFYNNALILLEQSSVKIPKEFIRLMNAPSFTKANYDELVELLINTHKKTN